MRTTLDKVAFYTLNAMADDSESLEQIALQVERYAGSAERGFVAQLLVQLIFEGLVREMAQQSDEPLTVEMILEEPADFWFSMTSEGRALWDSEAPKFCDEKKA